MPVMTSEHCAMCDPLPCIVDVWLGPPEPQTPDPPLETLLSSRLVHRFLTNLAPTVEALLRLPEPAPATNPDCRVHATLRSTRDLMNAFQTLSSPILDPTTAAPHHLLSLQEWLNDAPCQTLFSHLSVFSLYGANILANDFAEPVTRRLNRSLESPVSASATRHFGYLLILETVEEAWRSILIDEIYFQHTFFFAQAHIHRLQTTFHAPDLLETDLYQALARLGSLYGPLSQYAAFNRAILNHFATSYVAASLVNNTPQPQDHLRPFFRRDGNSFVFDPQWFHADESRVALKAECRQWLAMLHQRNSVWLLLDALGIELSQPWETILDVQMQALDECSCSDNPTVHDDESAAACLLMGNTLMLLDFFMEVLLMEYPTLHFAAALPAIMAHTPAPYPN